MMDIKELSSCTTYICLYIHIYLQTFVCQNSHLPKTTERGKYTEFLSEETYFGLEILFVFQGKQLSLPVLTLLISLFPL